MPNQMPLRPKIVYVRGRRYKIQGREEDVESWPERVVIKVVPVENVWDNQNGAVQATLECGHKVYLTGDHQTIAKVRCQRCAGYDV